MWKQFTLAAIAIILLSMNVFASERPKTVPAWRNTVDRKAAEEVMRIYSSNVIRCEWAGEDPKIASLMPANLACQFAVIGDSDVTNRVQKILGEVAGAFAPRLRKTLEKHGLLNPTLQWIFRSCRPGVTNVQQFVSVRNHPAAFRETDFDLPKMKYLASRLTFSSIPLPVAVKFQYLDDMAPLGRAYPGADYPDVLPEETFTLPFGCAIVARAQERKRKIRLSVSTWPFGKATEYVWRSTSGGVRIVPRISDRYQAVTYDVVDVVYDVTACRPRMDMIVWAKFGKELLGPPTVVSIYDIPYVQRRYAKGFLESISYLKNSPQVPYDVSPIWIPREWKDVFERNGRGQTISFERTVPGSFRGDVFSAIGEIVHSMSASGLPEVTSKVAYYICPETGMLKYREVGNEIRYKTGESPYRRSGE